VFGGEHHDIQSGDGSAAHRVDVRYRVRRRDLAEPVGVVDRWRDEIDGTDDRKIVCQAVDGRVIGSFDADQKVVVRRGWQPAQRARQIRRADLGRSTAGTGESGQGLLFQKGHRRAP
jgi:hypothetical protein